MERQGKLQTYFILTRSFFNALWKENFSNLTPAAAYTHGHNDFSIFIFLRRFIMIPYKTYFSADGDDHKNVYHCKLHNEKYFLILIIQ